MHIAVIFTIAQRVPRDDELISRRRHTRDYYLAVKRKIILTHVTTGTGPEDVRLSV